MTDPTALFDRKTLLGQRARAMRNGPALFLHEEAALELKERLKDVNRSFRKTAIVTGFRSFWGKQFPDADIIADDETLNLQPESHDLIVHAMALHWASDPVGQLVQCRRALRPDGLLIAVLLGGQTLVELRAALAQAETQLTGGLSPRVAPMSEIRDMGGLLQRAGLALPVADSVPHNVSYASPMALMHDLRAMGEGNALAARQKNTPPKHLFERMTRIYTDNYSAEGGRVHATFEMIFLTGWAPDASQPQALRPGSAKTRLADFLNTTEFGENAKPVEGEESQ